MINCLIPIATLKRTLSSLVPYNMPGGTIIGETISSGNPNTATFVRYESGRVWIQIDGVKYYIGSISPN